jgi:hypothetical protein
MQPHSQPLAEPIVFLLQEPTTSRDLSSAEKYGKIIPIIGAEEKPSINIAAALNKMLRAMSTYSPENDFVCFAGSDPIVQFLLGIAAERLQISEITHLIWQKDRSATDRTSGYYLPKKVQLRTTKKEYEDFSYEQ